MHLFLVLRVWHIFCYNYFVCDAYPVLKLMQAAMACMRVVVAYGRKEENDFMDFLKEQIEKILPHRKSALMIDQAFAVEPGHFAKTQTFIDPGWPVFEGHFPDKPMLPGIYITEIMAQAADVMLLTMPDNEALYPILFQVKQMTYLQPVLPGTTLEVHAECVQDAGQGMYECKVKAYVGEKRVASGTLTLCLRV